MHSLAGIDLNLVVALHALVEESSVTRAAGRIGLSQPAMSHALGRLREHFDDPLLTRSGRGMVPTPRALALLDRVRPVVAGLEEVFSPAGPDASDLVTLRLATDDAIGLTSLPELLATLARDAPHLEVDVRPRGAPGRKRMLRRGDVDLAIGFFSGAGMDLQRRPLYEDSWVGVARRDHPLLEDPSLDRWLAFPHAVVSPTGGRTGEVDRVLAGIGRSRRVAVAIPHFGSALAAVVRTDLVLTTHRRLATMARALGLALFEPPIVMDSIPISMMWHPRTEHDASHRWIRNRVSSLLTDESLVTTTAS